MRLRVLTENDLRAALDMPAAIECMRTAFAQLATGGARVPVRTALQAGGVTLLAMPGALEDPAALGAKLVTVAPGNRDRRLPAIHAVVVLLDPRSGAPAAVMDAEWLTALRTGAGSGLATELLAPPQADTLAVIGAGVQARTQIQAIRAVRPIREIRIHSRTRTSAERLAAELEGVHAVVTESAHTAVAGARVVVTATDSSTPVIPEGLAPGTHVNAVGGYRPDMQELPSGLVARARVVVDQRDAALVEAGDLTVPAAAGLLREEEVAELGEVVIGRRPGRTSPDQITVFKSVGNAAQDLAAAHAALAAAEARNLGTLVQG